jgi:hypothetical protein
MRQARLAVANGWLEPSLPALPQQVTQVDNSKHANNNMHEQQLQMIGGGGKLSNDLQEEQKQAAKEVKAAEHNHRLAAELLANARRAKDNVDEKMKVNVEASTDELLSVKCRWNENYKSLVSILFTIYLLLFSSHIRTLTYRINILLSLTYRITNLLSQG